MLAPEHKGELNFLAKRKAAPQAKQAMARRLESMLPAGSTVFLDGGSSVFEAACGLLTTDKFQVFTNSLPILELARKQGRSISIIGGTLRQPSLAMVGSLAARWLDALWFDFAILGASGLHPEKGAFTTESEEATIKRKAALQSERRILLADSTKWERQAAVGFLEWKEVSDWIVDASLPEKNAKTLRANFGVNVLLA